jgi:hypothetical protein
VAAQQSLWRRLWDRLSLGQLRWIVLVVVLAASALLGGLDRANHVTPVALGTAYAAGPLTITPQSVSLLDFLPEFADLPPDCRYLVLAAKVENTANETVPLQPVNSSADPNADCHSDVSPSQQNVFEMQTPRANYLGVFRGPSFAAIPVVEPGFTYDYSVVWLVSASDIREDRAYAMRIYEMAAYISTFRIARDWARTEVVRYAEVRGAV